MPDIGILQLCTHEPIKLVSKPTKFTENYTAEV